VSDAALAEIKRKATGNQVSFTGHARKRMAQRGAIARDVISALVTATSATWQTDNQNYRVEGGVDLDGDEMTVIVTIEANVIVITLF